MGGCYSTSASIVGSTPLSGLSSEAAGGLCFKNSLILLDKKDNTYKTENWCLKPKETNINVNCCQKKEKKNHLI